MAKLRPGDSTELLGGARGTGRRSLSEAVQNAGRWCVCDAREHTVALLWSGKMQIPPVVA